MATITVTHHPKRPGMSERWVATRRNSIGLRKVETMLAIQSVVRFIGNLDPAVTVKVKAGK